LHEAGAKGKQRERETKGRCKGQADRDKGQVQRASRLHEAGRLTWKGPDEASAAESNCSALEWMRSRVSLERMWANMSLWNSLLQV